VFGAIQYFGMATSGLIPWLSLGTFIQLINVAIVLAAIIHPTWMRNPFHIVFLFGGLDLLAEALGLFGDVSNLTHLAGFVFAFLYLLVRYQLNAWTVYRS
jgi:hypothetical protein